MSNPLRGVLNHKRDVSFNFVMRDGQQSEYPCTDIELEEVSLPTDRVVRLIRIREFNEAWHPDMYGDLKREKTPTMFQTKKHRSIVALHGIELFDDKGELILQAGFF